MSLLPTPVAHPDGKSVEAHLAMKARMGGGRVKATDLRVVLQLLPTPTARDSKGTDAPGRAGGVSLPVAARDVERWGEYAEAIANWEGIIGRPAPEPLEEKHLNPRFVEWMMGYPEGWVDGASLTQQLKMLGNSVVERQAGRALAILMERSQLEF